MRGTGISSSTLVRQATALLLGAVLAVGAGPSTAHADPLADAQHKAAALRTQVDALQQRAELATEAYDAAYAKLGVAVTAHLGAERDLAAAQDASVASQELAARRARALYMSGGPAGLYAQALDGASITDVAQGVHQVSVVLAADNRSGRQADQTVSLRADAERRMASAAAASTALQKEVAARADAVTALLGQTDALLAAANDQVRALADQQRQALAAAAGAQGRAALAAARAALGNLPQVPPTQQAGAALAFAEAQVGKPYVWGATGPDAYDCSGLTQSAYASAGVVLPRVAADQWYAGQHVELGALEPGDLLFWATNPADPSTIHHVALYAGGGLMVSAPHTGDVVHVQPVFLDGYVGAVRPVP